MSVPRTDAISTLLARARRRLWWSRAERRVRIILWGATAAGAVAIGLGWWLGEPGAAGAVVGLTGTVAVLIAVLRSRPGLVTTARRVDRHVGGESLLTTGLELILRGGALDDAERLIVVRAAKLAEATDTASSLPGAPAHRVAAPALCLVALLVLSQAPAGSGRVAARDADLLALPSTGRTPGAEHDPDTVPERRSAGPVSTNRGTRARTGGDDRDAGPEPGADAPAGGLRPVPQNTGGDTGRRTPVPADRPSAGQARYGGAGIAGSRHSAVVGAADARIGDEATQTSRASPGTGEGMSIGAGVGVVATDSPAGAATSREGPTAAGRLPPAIVRAARLPDRARLDGLRLEERQLVARYFMELDARE